MSAITPDQYNDFGKTSCINQSYIPETFCVGNVGQYISSCAERACMHDIINEQNCSLVVRLFVQYETIVTFVLSLRTDARTTQ